VNRSRRFLASCRNPKKSLEGIKTSMPSQGSNSMPCVETLRNPWKGLKLSYSQAPWPGHGCRNPKKSLEGIKTSVEVLEMAVKTGRNPKKSLEGIKT